MKNDYLKKYLPIVGITLLFYLSFLIIKPYIRALLLSVILAYLFFPFNQKLKKVLKHNTLTAAVTTIIITIIITIPLIFLATTIISESIDIYNSGIIDQVTEKVSTYLGQTELPEVTNKIASSILIGITTKASAFLVNLASSFFNFVLAILTTFFLLMTGEDIKKEFKKTKFSKKYKGMLGSLESTVNAIVYGFFLIGIVNFMIALIGFHFLSIESATILALIIGLAAILPFVGPTIVWVPLTIVKAFSGEYTTAVLVLILGIILSAVETLGRPYIIGKKANLNPITVLFGVFGGVTLLGVSGIIIGPLILSSAVIIIKEIMKQ